CSLKGAPYVLSQVLPNYFHSELYLSRRCDRGVYRTRATHGDSIVIEEHAVIDRSLEIRVIQDIEEFGAELNIEGLRNSGNVVVLEDGKVKIEQPGTVELVATSRSQYVHASAGDSRERLADRGKPGGRHGRRETVQVQVVDASGNGIAAKVAVGEVPGVGVVLSQGIAAH